MTSFGKSFIRLFALLTVGLSISGGTTRALGGPVNLADPPTDSDTLKITDETGKVIKDFFNKDAMLTAAEENESAAGFLITLAIVQGFKEGSVYLTEPDCPKGDADCKPSSFASDVVSLGKTTVSGKDALAVLLLSDCPKPTDCVIEIPDGATKISETGGFQDLSQFFFPSLFDPKTGMLLDPKKRLRSELMCNPMFQNPAPSLCSLPLFFASSDTVAHADKSAAIMSSGQR
jgi:hypothetical protein